MTNPAEGSRREAGGQGASPEAIRKRLDSLIEMERAVDRRPDLNFLKKKLGDWGFGELNEADRQAIEKDYGEYLGGSEKVEPLPSTHPKIEATELKMGGRKREQGPAKGEKKPNRVFLGYVIEPDSADNWVVYEKYQTLDKRRGKYREQPPARAAIRFSEEILARMKAEPDFLDAVIAWMEERRLELGPESESSERLRLFPDRVDEEEKQETSFEPRWKYGVTAKSGKRKRESNELATGVSRWSEADKSLPVENPDEIPWDILDMIQKFEYGEMLRRGKAPAWEKRTYKEYVAEMKSSGHDVAVPYWKDGGYNSWIGKAAQRKRENILNDELNVRNIERLMRRAAPADEEPGVKPAERAVAVSEPKELKALPEWRGKTEESPEEPTEPETAEPTEKEAATGKDAIREWVGWIAKPETAETAAEQPTEEPSEPAAAEAPAAIEKLEAEPITDEQILEKAKPLVNQQITALSKLYKLPDEATDLAEWSAKVVRASLADSYRRQGDKETATRMLKDDSIVEKLAGEALIQIGRLGKADEEIDRRAEEMLRKYSPNRETESEEKAESPEERRAALRRSLNSEIIMCLSEWSGENGFESVAERIIGLAEAVLNRCKVTDCARLDDAGKLVITDRKKFDESMRKKYLGLIKK